MAFCVKCGKPLEGPFCGTCGADNRANITAVEEAPVVPSTEPEAVPVAAPAADPVAAPAATVPPVTQQVYSVPPQPVYTPPAIVPAKKPLPKWVIPVVAIVAAIVIGLVAYFVIANSNIGKSDEQLIAQRVESFEKAFSNGDWNGLVACFDSNTRSLINSNEELAEVQSYFSLVGGMMSVDVTVTNIEIEGNTATADMELTMSVFGESDTSEDEITLIKEGNDWYLNIDPTEMF